MAEKTGTVLFVHGAWNSRECWASVMTAMTAMGFSCRAIDLPSVDRGDSAPGDMYADAEMIRGEALKSEGPVSVVAHSYGGVPTTEGLAGVDNVSLIVYVAAFMLDVGQSLLGAVGGEIPGSWKLSADGARVEVRNPADVLFNDCDATTVEQFVARLRPNSRIAFEQPLKSAAWRDIPTHYVVCTDDHALPSPVQEQFARRASKTTSLPSGHSPFASRPQDLASALAQAVTG